MDVILVLIVALILIGIVSGIIYLITWIIFRIAKKPGYYKWARWISAVPAVVILFFTFEGLFPPDEFYLGEMEMAINQKPPASAEVEDEYSTYPDLHGDYESWGWIRMDKKDVEALRSRLVEDSEFKSGRGWGSAGMDAFKRSHGEVKFDKVFDREVDQYDQSYSIHFASDGEHILVQAART